MIINKIGDKIMRIISFKKEFLDLLLSSRKQQTSRKKKEGKYVPKIGEQFAIYNELRTPIITKPIRKLTPAGVRRYQDQAACCPLAGHYYAHLLGIVTLTNVYEITPSCYLPTDSGCGFLERWARMDGFKSFSDANRWFTETYDSDWIDRTYVVQQWEKWDEVYFYAED